MPGYSKIPLMTVSNKTHVEESKLLQLNITLKTQVPSQLQYRVNQFGSTENTRILLPYVTFTP